MEHLPYELQTLIFTFTPIKQLCPLSHRLTNVMVSNIVWKPLVKQRFGFVESNNYHKEYCWLLKLERHQFCYQRQWTLGCVGRISPLEKDFWPAAAF